VIFAGPITLSSEQLTAILVVLAIVALLWFFVVLATVWWGAAIGHDLAHHAQPRRTSRGLLVACSIGVALSPLLTARLLPTSLGLVGVLSPSLLLAFALGIAIGRSGPRTPPG
jgi:hypothetical protein